MFVLRNQPKGARFASFGLGLCVFALMPTEIGYQDIASLLARQPGVAERWQKRVFSAVGSIQVATFSFGRPIGTFSPQTATYRLAQPRQPGHRHHRIGDAQSAGLSAAALSGLRFSQGRPHAEGRSAGRDAAARRKPQVPPSARRRPRIPRHPMHRSGAPRPPRRAVRRALRRSIPELQAALSEPPLPQYDVSLSLEARPAGRSQDLSGMRSRSRLRRHRRATTSPSRLPVCFSARRSARPKASSGGGPARSLSS